MLHHHIVVSTRKTPAAIIVKRASEVSTNLVLLLVESPLARLMLSCPHFAFDGCFGQSQGATSFWGPDYICVVLSPAATNGSVIAILAFPHVTAYSPL